MERVCLVLILAILALSFSIEVQGNAECYNYRFLNESDRARTFTAGKESPQCDLKMSGWYRFGGDAGNRMADSCVPMFSCGTNQAGWLSGSHPAVADGAVQRKVCFSWTSGCCHSSNYISVRNCGRFYVYKLKSPSVCFLRYCGNGLTNVLVPKTSGSTSVSSTSTTQTTDAPFLSPQYAPNNVFFPAVKSSLVQTVQPSAVSVKVTKESGSTSMSPTLTIQTTAAWFLSSQYVPNDRFFPAKSSLVQTVQPSAVQEKGALCPSGWTRFNSYCYLASNTSRTWDQAKAHCEQLGGQLVKITSAEENQFVLAFARKLAPTVGEVWIGLKWNSKKRDFVWSDQSLPTYRNWGGGEPNGNGGRPCSIMWITRKQVGKWNDRNCGKSSTYPAGCVCKRVVLSATANPDTGIEGKISGDDQTWVYANGKFLGVDNGKWTAATSFYFPADIQIIAVYVKNVGGYGGFIASFGNGIVSDSSWKCTTQCVRNWHTAGFDDSSWPAAKVHSSRDKYRPGGMAVDAKWIGPSSSLDVAFMYCRRRMSILSPSLAPTTQSVTSPTTVLGALCPSGWTRFKSYCYLANSTGITWDQAKAHCEELGSELVKITSVEENQFVANKLFPCGLPPVGKVWIGLKWNSKENDFFWFDQSLPTYRNWGRGEPNGDDKTPCSIMLMTGNQIGKWNDRGCGVSNFNPAGFVCKRIVLSAVCPPEKLDGVSWSATVAGKTDIKPCPNGARGTASRKCSHEGAWGSINFMGCSSEEFIKLSDQINAIVDGSQTELNAQQVLSQLANATQPIKNSSVRPPQIYGGDLVIAVDILVQIAKYNDYQGNVSSTEDFRNYAQVASNLLDPVNSRTWEELNKSRQNSSQILVKAMDDYGMGVAGTCNRSTKSIVQTKNLMMRIDCLNPDFPLSSNEKVLKIEYNKSSIYLPTQAFSSSQDSRVVTVVYLTLNDVLLLAKEKDHEDGPAVSAYTTIVSSTVYPRSPEVLSQPVKIVLQNDKMRISSDATSQRKCVFWRPEESATWKTSGCRFLPSESDVTITTCECDHLTIFAALMDPYGSTGNENDKEALEIISIVGCSISLLSVLIAIIALTLFVRPIKTGVKVLLNLCAAIAITCAIVIFEGLARNKAGCPVVAALLHYFLLALFSWMLCEGVLHYIVIVLPFGREADAEDKMKYFYLFGWGFPAIVVTISLAVTQANGYGYTAACWLDVESGLIWAFIAPALAVILINFVVLILVIRRMMEPMKGKVKDKTQIKKLRAGVKASAILLPLLGITWLFGLLSFSSDTIAFKYIFAIFNSLQGLMIVIFHCARKIKEAVSRRLERGSKRNLTKRDQLLKPTSNLKVQVQGGNILSKGASV